MIYKVRFFVCSKPLMFRIEAHNEFEAENLAKKKIVDSIKIVSSLPEPKHGELPDEFSRLFDRLNDLTNFNFWVSE